MRLNPSHVATLLVKDFWGIQSADEKQEYANWLAADERNEQMAKSLLDKSRLKDSYEQYLAIDVRQARREFRARLRKEGIKLPRRYWFIWRILKWWRSS